MTTEPNRKRRPSVFADRTHSEAKDSLIDTLYFVAEMSLLFGFIALIGWFVS